MNWFIDLAKCCGCAACEQVCPQKCITMTCDDEGFLFPIKVESECVSCGLCEKVCPVKNQNVNVEETPKAFVYRTDDEKVLDVSSSGGFFSLLSAWVISQGGVVFGARFSKNWDVIIDYTDTYAGLSAFRGSKYVAASVGNAFRQAREFLEEGKLVLFTGTPCQISGLTHFLRRPYDNLLAVDLMCHSVPSPKVWHYYLQSICHGNQITDVTFRSKHFGWSRYGLKVMSKNEIILHEPNDENPYMKGFIVGLFNRKSCSQCPARGLNTGSDIMIGDYWEIDEHHHHLNDDRGMSLLLALTDKGKNLVYRIGKNACLQEIPYDWVDTKHVHHTVVCSASPHPNRSSFFSSFKKHPKKVELLIAKYLEKTPHVSLFKRVKRKIKKNIQRVYGTVSE